MIGKRVILRCFQDIPKVARVCEIREDRVFVTSEENYKSLRSGQKAFDPVGFRREDVYPYRKETLDNREWGNLSHL